MEIKLQIDDESEPPAEDKIRSIGLKGGTE
jgi:hypothetical protein